MSTAPDHPVRTPAGPVTEPVASASAGADEAAFAIDGRRRRQLILITLAAIAIYAILRLLPTGTNLNHMDFRVQGANSFEFCDALNPQFIPVVAVRSPVTMTAATLRPPKSGDSTDCVLTLRTASGKPLAPQDLLVVHTRRLHLMVVDASLTDYQHLHPQPGRVPGEWTFSFTPRLSGTYRLFADFTPVATAKGLYATTDVEVRGSGSAIAAGGGSEATGRGGDSGIVRDGFRYELAAARELRTRQPIDFTFRIDAVKGGPVPLQPVMGAFAHLVAFDVKRSGFAHLHPAQADPLAPPDAEHPVLKFKLTIRNAGRYVIWAQVNVAGREVFVPFWFDVAD